MNADVSVHGVKSVRLNRIVHFHEPHQFWMRDITVESKDGSYFTLKFFADNEENLAITPEEKKAAASAEAAEENKRNAERCRDSGLTAAEAAEVLNAIRLGD